MAVLDISDYMTEKADNKRIPFRMGSQILLDFC